MWNFQDLPDELILQILSYSDTKELISCGQVSKRIRKISHDGSLWIKANLEKKIVKAELLEMILSKGCKILNLSNSTIHGSLSSSINFQLRVLDLSQSGGMWPKLAENVEELLFSSPNVEKLDLTGLGITDDHVKILLQRCNKIKALSLEGTLVSNHSLMNIRRYLNLTLEELELPVNTDLTFTDFLKLKSMPRLKILSTCLYNENKYVEDVQKLRQYLPHLTIKVDWEKPSKKLHPSIIKNGLFGKVNIF